jgi:hypothetical protein
MVADTGASGAARAAERSVYARAAATTSAPAVAAVPNAASRFPLLNSCAGGRIFAQHGCRYRGADFAAVRCERAHAEAMSHGSHKRTDRHTPAANFAVKRKCAERTHRYSGRIGRARPRWQTGMQHHATRCNKFAMNRVKRRRNGPIGPLRFVAAGNSSLRIPRGQPIMTGG